MNIACPRCSSIYRIDPSRVPHGGIVARCRECGAHLSVEPGESPPGEVRSAALAPGAEPVPEPGPAPSETAAPAGAGRAGPAAPVFGPQDPETRAKRLARALVSDIVVYNPAKWKESRAAGTLRREFRDEILKSWEEYVEQVGEEMAKKSPYFRDALNAILAEGEAVF
jgi:predicted Zn finger-like uncharacterized protein